MKTLEEKREYNRMWSKKNAKRRCELNNNWRRGQGSKFQEYKKTLSCYFCTEAEPCCLHFHHKDPKEKDLEIANAARRWSWKHLLEEIKKCVVVCANCHEKVHAGILILPE